MGHLLLFLIDSDGRLLIQDNHLELSCWAHNPKVGGSNPPPATNLFSQLQAFSITSPAHFPLTLLRAAPQPARVLPVSAH
jgi:hypothetical protein